MTIKTWEQRMPARLPEGILDAAMMQCQCMVDEIDELRTENAALLAANRDSMDHYNELRAELDALKNQPPVAVFDMAINESVGAICYDFVKHKLPAGTKFYLAPGAQPVPDGYGAAEYKRGLEDAANVCLEFDACNPGYMAAAIRALGKTS